MIFPTNKRVRSAHVEAWLCDVVWGSEVPEKKSVKGHMKFVKCVSDILGVSLCQNSHLPCPSGTIILTQQQCAMLADLLSLVSNRPHMDVASQGKEAIGVLCGKKWKLEDGGFADGECTDPAVVLRQPSLRHKSCHGTAEKEDQNKDQGPKGCRPCEHLQESCSEAAGTKWRKACSPRWWRHTLNTGDCFLFAEHPTACF